MLCHGPLGEEARAFGEIRLGRPAEVCLGGGDVRDCVANITCPKFAGDFRRRGVPKRLENAFGGKPDRDALAGADIENSVRRLCADTSQDEGLDDIVDKNEVAIDFSIFKYAQRSAFQDLLAEDGQDACIGIPKRLAWPVDVL